MKYTNEINILEISEHLCRVYCFLFLHIEFTSKIVHVFSNVLYYSIIIYLFNLINRNKKYLEWCTIFFSFLLQSLLNVQFTIVFIRNFYSVTLTLSTYATRLFDAI